MDAGTEGITNADTVAAVRRQARRVLWKSALAALLLTALYLLVT